MRGLHRGLISMILLGQQPGSLSCSVMNRVLMTAVELPVQPGERCVPKFSPRHCFRAPCEGDSPRSSITRRTADSRGVPMWHTVRCADGCDRVGDISAVWRVFGANASRPRFKSALSRRTLSGERWILRDGSVGIHHGPNYRDQACRKFNTSEDRRVSSLDPH